MKKTLISAGIVPVFYRDDVPHFLLLRADAYWDFPKGLVEKDESSLMGAVRELREETAITDAVFRCGNVFYETEPYSNNKLAKYFVAYVKTDYVKLIRNRKTGIVERSDRLESPMITPAINPL